MKRLLDVVADFEQLRGALVGKTIQGVEIVQQGALNDILSLALSDGSRVNIDTFLLSPIEVIPK